MWRQQPERMEIMRFFWLALLLMLAACNHRNSMQQSELGDISTQPATDLQRVQEGIVAPDFALESKDGDLVTLSSYRGKSNVVLVFYRGYW